MACNPFLAIANQLRLQPGLICPSGNYSMPLREVFLQLSAADECMF